MTAPSVIQADTNSLQEIGMSKSARQMNAKPSSPGTKAAGGSPAKHQFIGTNPTKKTSGPSLYTSNVGPEGAPYSIKEPYTNGGKN